MYQEILLLLVTAVIASVYLLRCRAPRSVKSSLPPMASTEPKQCPFPTERCHDQSQCPLFSILPGEVRNRVFEFALTDYEDASNAYDTNTCYRRPEYLAPRKTYTQLLLTCQLIYREAWYLPWANAEHAFYLAWTSRKPPRTTTVAAMQRTLQALKTSNIQPDISHVRVFAQLINLENGTSIQQILDMDNFRPRSMTITLRHTDIWSWESDAPLHVGAKWVHICRFPDSVREIRVDFESLERKKDQVNAIAQQAADGWVFRRRDGTLMSAEKDETAIARWSGSSTWEGQRWLRDETRPEELDYYIATVVWRVNRVPDTAVTNRADASHMPNLDALQNTAQMRGDPFFTSVRVTELQAANVPVGTGAEDVMRLLREYRASRGLNAAGRRIVGRARAVAVPQQQS